VSPGTDWIAVGRITRAHGVKGEVAVLPLSDVQGRFLAGSRLFAGDDVHRQLTVTSSRPHQQRLLVVFDELRDRDAAQAVAGEYLFVPAEEAPPLPDGEYWPHELEGCEVSTVGGRTLGHIREIVRTPANDVWVAEGAGSQVLIPALKDVVESVDVSSRRVVVREVPGLTTT
jgi:16S rRNA processing protein RimM